MACRSSINILTTFRKYWSVSKNLTNIFEALGDFRWLEEVLEKYLPPTGSSGVFVKSYMNILKLGGLCMACRSSGKIFTNFRKV